MFQQLLEYTESNTTLMELGEVLPPPQLTRQLESATVNPPNCPPPVTFCICSCKLTKLAQICTLCNAFFTVYSTCSSIRRQRLHGEAVAMALGGEAVRNWHKAGKTANRIRKSLTDITLIICVLFLCNS